MDPLDNTWACKTCSSRSTVVLHTVGELCPELANATAEFEGVEITLYRSTHDGALVVDVDTKDDTGFVRINLNDYAIYDADPNQP